MGSIAPHTPELIKEMESYDMTEETFFIYRKKKELHILLKN